MSNFPKLRERVGDKLVDIWIPVSFLLTYVGWVVQFYLDGEFKSFGDTLAGLVIAVLCTVFTFWVTAIALLILAVPVYILCKTVARLFSK